MQEHFELNNDKLPLVSVIIPLYNSGNYIKETIQNVLEQSYKNIEILVVDDGSSDNSLKVAKSFESNKVKIFTQPNKGASAARNLGLREAKGEFIQFLDADDLLSTNKIEEQVKILNQFPDMVSTSMVIHFFDGEQLHIPETNIPSLFFFDSDNPGEFLLNLYGGNGEGGLITVHSWLTPKHLIDKAGFWNETLTVDDDGEFFCRVLMAGKGVRHEKLGRNYYRKYRKVSSLSSKADLKGIKSILDSLILKEQHLGSLSTHPFFKKAFSRAYKRLAVQTYPRFKDISKFCEQRINELGGSDHDVTIGGKQIEFVKKIAGWKVAKLLQESIKKS